MDFALSWEVVSFGVGLLIAIGLGVLALDDFKIARVCFLIAAIYASAGVVVWGTHTPMNVAVRISVIWIAAGGLAVLGVESFRYVNHKRELREKQGRPAPPPTSTAKPIGTEPPPVKTEPKAEESRVPSHQLPQKQPGAEQQVVAANEETLAQKREFLSRLTKLYMASHDGISSEMMAGLEMPPDDWLNEQLRNYKKDWRVEKGQIVTARVAHKPASTTSPNSGAKPTVEQIRITEQKAIPSPHTEAPYGLQFSIQTNVTLQPVTVFIQCSGPITKGDYILPVTSPWIGSHEVIQDHPNIFGLRLSQPAFRPEEPIVVHLYSKEKIQIVKFWTQDQPQY